MNSFGLVNNELSIFYHAVYVCLCLYLLDNTDKMAFQSSFLKITRKKVSLQSAFPTYFYRIENFAPKSAIKPHFIFTLDIPI